MVKDFFRGFGYTIGKILAFFFIAFLIMFLFTNLDDVDIKKIPFKQLIMKVMFVESHALSKQAVFYYGVGTSNVGRYLALEDETKLTQGTTITHESGSYPNGLAVLVRDTTFDAGATYVLTFNYTIKTRYQYKLPTNFMSIGTWSNPNDNVGNAQVIVNTSTALSGTTDCRGISSCYETNITFTGQWYQQNNGTAIIGFSQFDGPNRVTWFKLNSFTTTKTSNGNADIINNNNQNTNIIINNNNQNTQNIVNAQNETTDAINDLNDTLTDTTQPNTNNFINNVNGYAPSMTPITDLLNMPYTLVNKFLNGFNGSCSSINLGTLYGTALVIPCIDLQSLLGSQLWGIIDVLCVGMLCLNIGELLIHDFNSLLTLNDEFEETYTPKHVYHPKHGRE